MTPPETYYNSVYRLIAKYRELGYSALVKDWEMDLDRVTDYPQIKNLAAKAEFLYDTIVNREVA